MLISCIFLGHLQVVNCFVEAGGKELLFYTSEGNDKTCLRFACDKGELNIVKYLVEAGGEELLLYTKGPDGMACLHYASAKGHFDVVKHLVKLGGKALVLKIPANVPHCPHYTGQHLNL
jgi:ankyrin repeat protein